MSDKFKVKIYVGTRYTETLIESDLNSYDDQGYKPMHIDTQEALAVIIWEKK